MHRPTLCIQTVYLDATDRDDARRLGSDLYNLLTRPANDPLAYGAGIPVVSAVDAEHVDLMAAEIVVLVPVLGKIAFQSNVDEIVEKLNDWHDRLGAGKVIAAASGSLWRSVETRLPGVMLLSEFDGAENAERRTLDEVLLAITRLLDSDLDHVQLFVSHAKKDLESTSHAAKLIHDHVVTDSTGKAFFDTSDLRPGESLSEQMDAAMTRGVVIAVRGDAFSSRVWCQRELLTAKQHGLPTLTVEILTAGEQRTSPYSGNGPCIVWDGNPAAVVTRAMVEWLRFAHFKREAERVIKAADLPTTTQIVCRPPELLDLAQGPLDASHAQLVLHPDPELSVVERQILKAAHPRLHLVTPTTAFRRLLARGDEVAVGTPLEGFQVAMSLSDSPDVGGPEGYTEQHLHDATVYVARSLISAGASIAYGGDFRRNGFTPLLAELILAHNATASAPADFLHSYLGAPLKREDAPDLPIRIHHLVHSKTVKDDALMPPPSEAERHPNALYYSDMRQAMTKHTDARVIIGGNAVPRSEPGGQGYGGRYPGIIEEAWRSLEAGQPLYVLGAFGGASALVAQLMDGVDEIPIRLRDETWMDNQYFRNQAAEIDASPYREALRLPSRMQDLAQAVREKGRSLLSQELASDEASISWNGLTRDENRILFRSRDPLILASLVLQGLLNVARERGRGKLEIELVRGSVSAASELDGIGLATFDDVPPGGAATVLDHATGGKARLGYAEGQRLIHIESPDIDADWLYLASLGSVANASQLVPHVERAARATSQQARRHGFRRLGIVAFGGHIAEPQSVAQAMLRGFADLAGYTTLVWFETDATRFEKIRSVLSDRNDVKLTTRRIATLPQREVVQQESLIVQVTHKKGQLSVTVLPPAGTGIASTRLVELDDSALAELGRGSGVRGRLTPSLDTLQTRGRKLAELVFGKEAPQILARCSEAKITVIHDVASSKLPFEILSTSDEIKPAAVAGISRRLTVAEVPVDRLFAKPPKTGPLEVVLVVNPTGDLPGTEAEAESVKGALAQHQDDIQINEIRGAAATKDKVLAALKSADVLHYCGHAFFDGPGINQSGLLLAGKEKLTLHDLQDFGSMPRVVFFNACEAGRVRGASFEAGEIVTEGAAFAEMILKAGVEAYIGTYWEVLDESAAKFATGVYTRLSSGEKLESAVSRSRADLLQDQHADWANYILYGEGQFTLSRRKCP